MKDNHLANYKLERNSYLICCLQYIQAFCTYVTCCQLAIHMIVDQLSCNVNHTYVAGRQYASITYAHASGDLPNGSLSPSLIRLETIRLLRVPWFMENKVNDIHRSEQEVYLCMVYPVLQTHIFVYPANHSTAHAKRDACSFM